MRTELGRISDMLESAVDLDTPLTKKLGEIGKYITIGVIAVSAVILTVGVYRALGEGIALAPALKETLIFAIALAVGAIPEGLPAVVTIALAIGVQRMARRNAIIRKLPAVETLGSTTVICSDKTGTLTCNEMTVTELWTPQSAARVSGIGYAPEGEFSVNGARVDHLPEPLGELVAAAALCNDAALNRENGEWTITGDPTEAALLVASAKAGQNLDALKAERPRLAKAADRAAAWFLGRILIGAAIVFAVWWIVDPTRAFPATLAVLRESDSTAPGRELVVVNGHIITRRAFQQSFEQEHAALYRKFSGKELDEKLKGIQTQRQQQLE